MCALYEAMSVVLMRGTGEEREKCMTEVDTKAKEVEAGHSSLIQADPNAFFADAGFFYRPPHQPRRAICTAGVKCNRATALIYCYSCERFEPTGKAYYCQACFDACHPWYRAPHKWVDVEDTGHLDQQLTSHLYTAVMDRNIDDIGAMVKDLGEWHDQMKTQGMDCKGDNLIKTAAQGVKKISMKIRDMKEVNNEDRTKISQVAEECVLQEAARLQKYFETQTVVGKWDKAGQEEATKAMHTVA